MKKKYQSELLGAIHETAEGLYKIGVINDKEMREYNKDCLASKTVSTESPDAQKTEVKRAELVTA
jgi:DNA-binding transcriptional regulator YiaG